MTAVVEAAQAWFEAGASVLPAKRGKRPDRDWADYQHQRLVPDGSDWGDGFGLITGYGGFEMLEIEGAAMEAIGGALAEALAQAGFLARLMTYAERTPSGGIHWVYKVPEATQEGSQKLARSADRKTMIETRGRFAWTVMAPSGGSIHDTIPGGRWEIIAGTPGVCESFTEEEIEQIYDICRSFDELPPPEPEVHRQPLQSTGDGSLAPGQDYEARTSWEAILEPLGWRKHPRGDAWTRPGKKFGISATITPSDNLYIWSSSVSPLEPEQSYTKFRVYSLTNCAGDDSEAARSLRAAGFGSPPAERVMIVTPEGIASSTAQRPSNQDQQGGGSPPTGEALGGDPRPLGGDSEGSQQVVTVTLTEDGNARLLAAQAKGKFLYIPQNKSWMKWTGTHWRDEPDDSGVVMLLRKMLIEWPAADKAEQRHKFVSLGARSVNNVVGLAKKDSLIRASVQELDADQFALNTPDGVVDLLTNELTPSDPSQLHSKITKVGVSFEKPERFLAFLRETFSEARDPEAMIEFIQRLAGYSTTGSVTHHVLPFLHGVGNNGKSVLLDIFQTVLGDYSGTAPTDLLLSTGKDDFAALAELHGKRLVVCSEIPPTARFHEQRAKLLTGGDRIAARRLYANYFEFVPSHHLWLAGNHQPQVPAGGSSFWRRLRLVPFDHVVPDDRIVEKLAQILVKEEGPQILGWMIQGAKKQLDIRKLAEPREVMAATLSYAEEEDHLGRFMLERIKIGGGQYVRVNTQTVRAAYEAWCAAEGIRPLPASPFGRELKNRGINSGKSNGQRMYVNMTLLNSENEPDDRAEQQRF